MDVRGSYLVARKIRIFVENRDRGNLQDQENVIGRAKVSGFPLSGGTEFSSPDFTANAGTGLPPSRRTPTSGWPASSTTAEPDPAPRLLLHRRIDPQAGTLLGGLFFIAFMKSPAQFVQLQQSLARDARNEYIQHTGSGVGVRLLDVPADTANDLSA